MSLDVRLTLPNQSEPRQGSGIFIRENGATREISRVEWDEKFPNTEPVTVTYDEDSEGNEVYWANITHNLNTMAKEAELYYYLWQPKETKIERAYQLIMPLRAGLRLLKSDPERFKQFDASNGWGVYENLVEFTEKYLAACERYPDAIVSASR